MIDYIVSVRDYFAWSQMLEVEQVSPIKDQKIRNFAIEMCENISDEMSAERIRACYGTVISKGYAVPHSLNQDSNGTTALWGSRDIPAIDCNSLCKRCYP